MCCDCECYDDYEDDFGLDYLNKNGSKMAKKDFVIEGGYYFDTLDEALKDASRRTAKNMSEVRIYQAIKMVAPTTPNVIVTDITVS